MPAARRPLRLSPRGLLLGGALLLALMARASRVDVEQAAAGRQAWRACAPQPGVAGLSSRALAARLRGGASIEFDSGGPASHFDSDQ